MDKAVATQAASDYLKKVFTHERHMVPNDHELLQLAARQEWLEVLKRLKIIHQWAEFEGQYHPPLRGNDALKNPSFQAGELLARVKGVYFQAIQSELVKQGDAFCLELILSTNPLRE